MMMHRLANVKLNQKLLYTLTIFFILEYVFIFLLSLNI